MFFFIVTHVGEEFVNILLKAQKSDTHFDKKGWSLCYLLANGTFLRDLLQNEKKNVIMKKKLLNQESEVQKMKKILGTVCNIIMALFYAPISLYLFFFGFFFLTLTDWMEQSWDAIFYFSSSALMILTPLFCILAIVLSAKKRKREQHAASFRVQFFPLTIIGLALILMFIPMF